MPESGSFPPSVGCPFTLWQDPARWPVLPLRLPGLAFTLWLDPSRWPQGLWRLPGLGYTLWLAPSAWPVPRLRLPSGGFTLWLNPVTTPPSAELSSIVVPPPLVMPIQISRNDAFTLWTRPNEVRPIQMKNGLTAAQFAAEIAPPSPIKPMSSASEIVPPSEAVSAAPSKSVPFAHRLLPLAAGIVAILGLKVLMQSTDSKQNAANQAGVLEVEQRLLAQEVRSKETKTANTIKEQKYQEKAAQDEATALVLKEENARLVTGLSESQGLLAKARGRSADLENQLRDLTTQTEHARLTASTADNQAQTLVVAAQEEAAVIKRVAAAESVKLRESLARLEAEKAAALSAAASAAREKAVLQQALDAFKKQAP